MKRGDVRKILERRIEYLQEMIVQKGEKEIDQRVAERNALNWLRAKLFDVPETEGWQPIETAPKDGRDVVVLWGSRLQGDLAIANYAACVDGAPAWLRHGVALFNVTHWLETPARPGRQLTSLKAVKHARRQGLNVRENAPKNASRPASSIE